LLTQLKGKEPMAETIALINGPVLGLTSLTGEVEASTPANLDDADLVREIVRTDDDDLFAILVRRHKLGVFRIVLAVLGPAAETEAEELSQEAFVQVFQKLASFRHECAFSTWLFKIARNLAIDRRRSARWRAPHLDDEVLQSVRDDCLDANPEERTAAQERRHLLISSLDQLSEKQRMVVLLFYWLDCSVAEIERLTDLNQQTIKSHLHRARQRLASTLAKEYGNG
jgi:RNA polymerase sigma-70 factor (ECF subfamily)